MRLTKPPFGVGLPTTPFSMTVGLPGPGWAGDRRSIGVLGKRPSHNG